MKNIIFLLIMMLFRQNLNAQTFYETSWISDGVRYTGLLVYYDDDDAIMRVNYTINNKYKVSEFNCYGEHFENDDLEGYLLDGRDAKVVYGNDGTGYSADNFIFINSGDTYSTPIHIDDQGMQKKSAENYLIEVDYWKEISTEKFTESYVAGFFRKEEPLYATLLSYNHQNNQGSGTGAQFRITSFSYGGGQWAVAMSQTSGYTMQSWSTGTAFPRDWIREKWDDNYYITSITYGGGEWAVAMSQGTKYSTQSWKTDSAYPGPWIKEKWDENLRITSMAYGGGEWAVVMGKNTGITMQSWNKTSYFPRDWINEKWGDNYRITSMAYGGGEWAVVMSQSTGYTMQTWKTDSAYPQNWIKEKWGEGYHITSIAYGGGEWAVVMSQGTGYSLQTWKTTPSYPKDWINEKWNGGSGTQNNQPAQIENSTLHLLLVTNTLISDIGSSCQVDKTNALNEFEIISGELGISINKVVISDREFSKTSVSKALTNLNPKSNDIVIFIYSGHGYRWSNQNSKYPNIDLRYSNYQSVSENTSYNLSDIYNTIINKGARLNIVIGDCCNSDIGISNRNGEASLTSRKQHQGRVDKLRTLFLESRGNLIAAAAKPYETSCGNSRDGGYFLTSFFAAINKETSRLNDNVPLWTNIISNTINSANYKTLNLAGCDPQNGIYYSTIK